MSKYEQKIRISFLGLFLVLFVCSGQVLASSVNDPSSLFTADAQAQSFSTNVDNFICAINRNVYEVFGFRISKKCQPSTPDVTSYSPVSQQEKKVETTPTPVVQTPPVSVSSPAVPDLSYLDLDKNGIKVITNTHKKVVVKKTTNDSSSSTPTNTSIISIIKNLLSQKEYQDLLRGPKGDSAPASIAPSSPAPIPVSYASIGIVQPSPVNNFSGATLFSVTDLSSKYFITSEARIGTLNVSGNSVISGDLTVNGTINGTISGSFNPSFTLGSIPFQGATGLAQDNANLFYDGTNHRLGLGTSSPAELLSLGLAGTTKGVMSLSGNTSGKVVIQPASIAGSWTLTLPTDDGAPNQFLQTDGNGVTSWQTVSNGGFTVGTTPIASGTSTRILYDNAGILGEYLVTGTGTTAVLSTSPTFSTSIVAPLLIGGTTTTSPLTLRSTSGVGTIGADIVFQVGNNGSTEAIRILNSGNVGIGDTTPAALFTVGSGDLFQIDSSGNIFLNQATPIISISNTGSLVFKDTAGSPNTLCTIADAGATGNFSCTGTGSFSNLSGTNTGDVTLSGENYLSISGQAITVGSVNLSGTNVTGTLAAARFGALTGDVTNSAGSYATTIANTAVTYAKFQNIAGLSVAGRSANSSGVGADITGTANQVLRVDGTGTALGFGTIANAGLTNSSISFALGTTGTDVTWSSSPVSLGATATLNIPDSSASNRGALNSTDWNTFNNKQATGLSWLLASGGTLTGTNTITAGSNPLILSTGVTTGTGATAGFQTVANSLTTGNGIDVSSSSITTGNLMKLTSTSTAGNSFSLLNINSSGANASSTRTATGQTISVTNTGTTSTNVGLNVTASGATNNYAALFTGNVGIGTATPNTLLNISGGSTTLLSGWTTPVFLTSTGLTRLAIDSTSASPNTGFVLTTGGGTKRWTVAAYKPGGGTNYSMTFYNEQSALADGFFINGDTNNLTVNGTTGGSRLSVNGGLAVGSTYYTSASPTDGAIIQGNVGIGATSPTGKLEVAQTITATGALKGIVYTGAVNTNQTLSTEIPSLTLTTAGREWATGALTTQREVLITQPTYSFVGASTITNAATVGIAGAPIKSTNATITNTHGLLIQAGAVSTATNSYGLTVNAQTGATNNYAAQFMGGNVGIGTASPSYTLEVGNNGVVGIVARFVNSTGTCDINPTTTTLSCSSDINLKKNITDFLGSNFILRNNLGSQLSSATILEKLTTLTPVNYNWNSELDNTAKHAGFIAQEVEQVFPDLVSTDPNTGLKSLGYTGLVPYTVEAVQELNIKITDIESFDQIDNSFGGKLRTWLADIGNGIENIFAKKVHTEQLCVKKSDGTEVCINGDQLNQLINGGSATAGGSGTPPPADEPVTDVCPNIDGNQSTVPDGMHLDDQNNCVADIITPSDVEPQL